MNQPKTPERRHWFSRFLRSASSSRAIPKKAAAPGQKSMRHRRSVSDLAHTLVQNRREPPQSLDLKSMVRISGRSLLYLPPDHAPGGLALPTCIRATAHYLIQHATTTGIFRIPGSTRTVNELYNYYCFVDSTATDVCNTVRGANLPLHIHPSVHDVASTFKRMLCVLPGGILGNLCLFDAFVAVNSQLQGDPEFPRTKQTKVRARLIALAVASIESQFRRELICAVFGLLSLIGRAAEISPREDEEGRPLPTGDLMGYSALGIVFGPLLVGDLLENYDMNMATTTTGLVVLPHTPKKQHRKLVSPDKPKPAPSVPPTITKIHVTNKITEMLISNWRDVVRQLKALNLHRSRDGSSHMVRHPSLRPSISESFVIKKPHDWDRGRTQSSLQANRDESPEPPGSPTGKLKPQRARSKKSINWALSPPQEESLSDEMNRTNTNVPWKSSSPSVRETRNVASATTPVAERMDSSSQTAAHLISHSIDLDSLDNRLSLSPLRVDDTVTGSPRLSAEDVPPRTSSKQGGKRGGVKAIAAIFEVPNPTGSSNSPTKHDAQMMVEKAKAMLEQKSSPTSASTSKLPPPASWSAKVQGTAISNSPVSAPKKEEPEAPRLRTSISDGVALRTAALVEAEKQHIGPSTERLPLAGLRSGFPPRKMESESVSTKDFQSQMRVGQSLGTMVPHREQPPVAQHLNLTRPPSSASSISTNGQSSLPAFFPPPCASLMRTSSTTSLHSHIRKLQRQLETKTDEAAQLRRQVEAQKDTDVGTLSEQLREAKREAQQWKE